MKGYFLKMRGGAKSPPRVGFGEIVNIYLVVHFHAVFIDGAGNFRAVGGEQGRQDRKLGGVDIDPPFKVNFVLSRVRVAMHRQVLGYSGDPPGAV